MDTDFQHIVQLIESAKERVYVKANSELVALYFNVGNILSDKISKGVWGDKTMTALAEFIHTKMPNLSGFNRRGLYRMKQFYEIHAVNSEVFKLWEELFFSVERTEKQDVLIVSPTATQFQKHQFYMENVLLKVSWSQHLDIFSSIRNPEEILFYLLQTITEKWTKAELRRQLKTATYERTLLAKQATSPMVQKMDNIQALFKDPYVFEFLDLPDNHSEKEFEKAIVLNLQKFILEIGKGFTYMGEQYRLQVGNKDYYTDLLFYHRDLQCLVLFELKIQDFEPEFLGKLNFYLEALDRDVKRPHENPSIGILLCKGKDTEVVEYSLARSASPTIIAEYQTQLIDKQLLINKLNQLLAIFHKTNDLSLLEISNN